MDTTHLPVKSGACSQDVHQQPLQDAVLYYKALALSSEAHKASAKLWKAVAVSSLLLWIGTVGAYSWYHLSSKMASPQATGHLSQPSHEEAAPLPAMPDSPPTMLPAEGPGIEDSAPASQPGHEGSYRLEDSAMLEGRDVLYVQEAGPGYLVVRRRKKEATYGDRKKTFAAIIAGVGLRPLTSDAPLSGYTTELIQKALRMGSRGKKVEALILTAGLSSPIPAEHILRTLEALLILPPGPRREKVLKNCSDRLQNDLPVELDASILDPKVTAALERAEDKDPLASGRLIVLGTLAAMEKHNRLLLDGYNVVTIALL